ncbi:MAG: hypothetical protein U0802_24065 [Candidatus Binatia bacterium]
MAQRRGQRGHPGLIGMVDSCYMWRRGEALGGRVRGGRASASALGPLGAALLRCLPAAAMRRLAVFLLALLLPSCRCPPEVAGEEHTGTVLRPGAAAAPTGCGSRT